MKESEFIELLNLYIDHEIRADDSVRLEAEVVSNPERRKVYRQYCCIHRACCTLAEGARAIAPEAEPVAARSRSRLLWSTAIYGAGLMAAACFVVIGVVRFHRPGLHRPVRVQSAAPGPAAAAVVLAAPVRSPLHPVVDLRNLTLSGENAGSPSLLSAEQNPLFAWMNRVQIAPIQRPSIDQVFNSPPVLLGPDSRPERTPEDLQTPVEMAAFRFQR